MFVTASNYLKFHQWPEDNTTESTYNTKSTSPITCASWSNDNNFLIYVQEGGRPEILGVKDPTGVKPVHLITAIDYATAVTFQKNTKRVVGIGTASSTVALYDTKNKAIIKLFSVRAAVTHLDFNMTDEYLAVACEEGTIELLNVVEGNASCSYSVGCRPSELRFHPSLPEMFAVGTKDGTLFRFNINQANPVYVERCHFGSVNGIVYSSKHNLLITIGEDYKMCSHDLNANICVYTGHLQFPLTALDITPDGKHVAVGTDRGCVYVYETRNLLTPLVKWSPHTERIRCVKFAGKPQTPPDYSKKVLSNESVETTHSLSRDKMRDVVEFKSLYNKFMNKSEDEDFLCELKNEIQAKARFEAQQVHIQTRVHMASLQDFIKKEFDKMTDEMDEKWSLLHLVADKQIDDVVDQIFYENDEPIILE